MATYLIKPLKTKVVMGKCMYVLGHFKKVAIVSAVALGIVGCGGGGGGTDVTITDTGAESIEFVVSPVNEETGVGVLSTLTLVASQPLDPDVINQVDVRLIDQNNKVIPISISYDEATHTVSVKPKLPLEHYVKYTVQVDGLKDASGAQLDTQQSSFYTTKNQRLFFELVNDTENLNDKLCELGHVDIATKLIDKVTYSAADTSGICPVSEVTLDLSRVLYYAVPSYTIEGRLQRWDRYTSDNVLERYEEYSFDTSNVHTRTDTYIIDESSNAVFTSYVSYEYDELGRLKRQAVRGANGIAQEYRSFEYDDLNRTLAEIVYSRPGQTSAWEPEISDATDYQVYDYAADNLSAVVTSYKQFGLDNKPGTSDDGAGPDGVMTQGDDDVPFSYTNIHYDTNGLITHQDVYLAKGSEVPPDLNPDNRIFYEDRQYDLEGNLVRVRAYQKSDDGNFVLVSTQEFDTTE